MDRCHARYREHDGAGEAEQEDSREVATIVPPGQRPEREQEQQQRQTLGVRHLPDHRGRCDTERQDAHGRSEGAEPGASKR